ncbi:10049_t:CDS:1, partial [Scutellospora calospora]
IKNISISEIRITSEALFFYNNERTSINFQYVLEITMEPLKQAKISLYLGDLWSTDISD